MKLIYVPNTHGMTKENLESQPVIQNIDISNTANVPVMGGFEILDDKVFEVKRVINDRENNQAYILVKEYSRNGLH